MNKLLLSCTAKVILCMFLSVYTSAQKLEIGGGLGFTNTRTDVSALNILDTRYGFWGFGRWNFDETWVFRLDYRYLTIGATDNHAKTPIASVRNYAFTNSIQEVSGNLEYNFLNYRSLKEKIRWCPYLTLGMGFNKYNAYDTRSGQGEFNFCIPFGLGVKYVLSRHFNLGLTFITTKTFTDKLDGLDKNSPSTIQQHLRGVDVTTNDWYYFLGLSVSYTLYSIKCPEFYDL